MIQLQVYYLNDILGMAHMIYRFCQFWISKHFERICFYCSAYARVILIIENILRACHIVMYFRALAGNLKLGGLEIFFPAHYRSRFFKNHSFQKGGTESLINPPISNCQKAWICSATTEHFNICCMYDMWLVKI